MPSIFTSPLPAVGDFVEVAYRDNTFLSGLVRKVANGIAYFGEHAAVVPQWAQSCRWRTGEGPWMKADCTLYPECVVCGFEKTDEQWGIWTRLRKNRAVQWYCSTTCRNKAAREMQLANSDSHKMCLIRQKAALKPTSISLIYR